MLDKSELRPGYYKVRNPRTQKVGIVLVVNALRAIADGHNRTEDVYELGIWYGWSIPSEDWDKVTNHFIASGEGVVWGETQRLDFLERVDV